MVSTGFYPTWFIKVNNTTITQTLPGMKNHLIKLIALRLEKESRLNAVCRANMCQQTPAAIFHKPVYIFKIARVIRVGHLAHVCLSSKI